MDVFEKLFSYDSIDEIDCCYLQFNNLCFKQDFYDILAGTKISFLAINFLAGTYSLGFKHTDEPNQWLNGKLEVLLGQPS